MRATDSRQDSTMNLKFIENNFCVNLKTKNLTCRRF